MLDLTPGQSSPEDKRAGAGFYKGRPMPEYNFVQDILRPYLRDSGRWKKLNTVLTENGIARVLERLFNGYWITGAPDDMRRHRPAINGRIVSQYRERRKVEGVTPNTVARELSVASGACRYAISEMNFDIPNPFAGRLISKSDARNVQPRRRQLQESEQASLLIACMQPLRDMLLLWLETGLRVTELRLLRHDQIALDERVVRFTPEEHKSGTFDASALTDDALAIISRQTIIEGCPYVFLRDGRPLPEGTMYTLFYAARKAAGCDDLQLRDMRRTALQRWRNAFGLEAAQVQARHRNRGTTERAYARPSVEIALDALKLGSLKQR